MDVNEVDNKMPIADDEMFPGVADHPLVDIDEADSILMDMATSDKTTHLGFPNTFTNALLDDDDLD